MAEIDNVTAIEDNNIQAQGTSDETGVAGVSAPEDTAQGYEQIIEAKDAIIGAYEKQVASLQTQISNLVRNGAAIVEEPKTPEAKAATENQGAHTYNYMGGFGKGIDAYSDGFDVKSLGREIGKRE